MPERLHRELERRAKKLGLKGERKAAYVYGTLQKVENRRRHKKQHTDGYNS